MLVRLAVFAALVFAAAAPAEDRFADLRALVDASVARGEAPGAVVVVRLGGQKVFEHAAGLAVIEEGRPMRPDDLFMIASSTKPFSATTVLTLVDRGLLDLDDPVRKFYPAFAGGSTVRQLLSHTSGMFGNDAPPETVEPIRNFARPLADAVPLILRTPLASAPGTKFSYGGASFAVAAGIVEKLTGEDFERYMRRVLLDPLTIADACFRSPKDLSARVPQIYTRNKQGRFVPQAAVMEAPGRRGPRPDGFVLAAGGLYATADETARFLQLHLDLGAVDGRRVLSERMALEMRRRQTGAAGEQYGLGWRRERFAGDGPAAAFSHGGAYGTSLYVDAERGLAAAIFTQMPGGGSKKLLDAVRQWLDARI